MPSHSTLRSGVLATTAATAALALGAPAALAEDFSGPFGLDQWTIVPMAEGTGEIAPVVARLSARYAVDLGNPGPGVTGRSASYQMIAADDGQLWVDWRWTGFHSTFLSEGGLELWADGPGGLTTIPLVPYGDVPASFAFSGADASIQIHAGFAFGLLVAGENVDSDSRLLGTIELDDLVVSGATRLVDGFTAEYAPENWTTSGIVGGVASIDLGLDRPADRAELSYFTSVPAGGVPYREGSWTVVPDADGVMSFDWRWTGFSAFFEALAGARVEIAGPGGVETVVLHPFGLSGVGFDFSGEADLDVYAGFPVTFIIGAENNDALSYLDGRLVLSNLDIDDPAPADLCPADVDGDAQIGFNDLLAVLAAWGNCP